MLTTKTPSCNCSGRRGQLEINGAVLDLDCYEGCKNAGNNHEDCVSQCTSYAVNRALSIGLTVSLIASFLCAAILPAFGEVIQCPEGTVYRSGSANHCQRI